MRSVPFLCLCVLLGYPLPAGAGFIDHFAETTDIGRNKIPHMGTSRILVLEVEFPMNDPPDWSRLEAFFAPEGGRGTFRDYWETNSLGRYHPIPQMVGPIVYDECPFPHDVNDHRCTIVTVNPRTLDDGVRWIQDVLRRAHEEFGVQYRDFDNNGLEEGVADGWVDGVILLANLPTLRSITVPIAQITRDPSLITFDGETKVGAVAVTNAYDWINVAPHEFGHLLGFVDLYDYDGSSWGTLFALMGVTFGEDEEAPERNGITLLDALSRVRIGWADLREVHGTETVRIPPAISSGVVYKLASDPASPEYFLLENRRPSPPYDTDIPGEGGLLVYHVNEAQAPRPGELSWVESITFDPNGQEFLPFIMNEQPDGAFGLQFHEPDPRSDRGNIFETGDLFLPSSPDSGRLWSENLYFSSNAYDGSPTGISIFAVDTESAAPDVLVSVDVPEMGGGCAARATLLPAAGSLPGELLLVLLMLGTPNFLRRRERNGG